MMVNVRGAGTAPERTAQRAAPSASAKTRASTVPRAAPGQDSVFNSPSVAAGVDRELSAPITAINVAKNTDTSDAKMKRRVAGRRCTINTPDRCWKPERRKQEEA